MSDGVGDGSGEDSEVLSSLLTACNINNHMKLCLHYMTLFTFLQCII